MSNSSDPDQARLFVRPDLGLNCLQMLSKDKQDALIAKRTHARNVQRTFLVFAHEMCMFFCHQVLMKVQAKLYGPIHDTFVFIAYASSEGLDEPAHMQSVSAFHARIEEFSSAGSRSVRQKKLSLFLVLSLFYRSRMVDFKEIHHFFSDSGGGGQHFPGGVQLLIPYRNPYNL